MRRTRFRVNVLACLALASTATCIPNLGPDDSSITSTRILAVRAVPAEAQPGKTVTFTSFVADPGGVVPAPHIFWDFCTAPLPLTEDNVVSNACLGSSSIAPAGQGAATSTPTPSDACAIYGPDVIQGNFRPPDPDSTGGYYQPLRAELAGAPTTFALARIRCDLPNASASAASAFAKAYKLNNNPTLSPLAATINGAPVTPTAVPAGASVALVASWPAASAETFAYYDPVSQTVTTQRESMQVAWYSTSGALDTEATGRASTDLATTSSNTWTAPTSAGPTYLFVVLRDSRGGGDFQSIGFTVTE
jgi:hypothetical protein